MKQKLWLFKKLNCHVNLKDGQVNNESKLEYPHLPDTNGMNDYSHAANWEAPLFNIPSFPP